MRQIVVFDIDGCCLDPSERLPHLISGDYETYLKMWETDKPIRQGVAIYSAFLMSPAYTCLFITSRSEGDRANTTTQLTRLFGPQLMQRARILMRDNDYEGGRTRNVSEYDIKPMLLQEAGYKLSEVFLAFDDRDIVVKGWRDRGVTCYQTDYGDF